MSYSIAVRALCEFTAKAGDLDLRFTPSPTAREGMEGHQVVTARRAADYEREVSLRGEYKELTVKGRADGYDPSNNRLEEIKTFRGELDAMPENHRALHWAQAKIYGWLLCAERDLDEIELALVYFDVAKQKETSIRQRIDREALKRFFDDHCEKFLHWAQGELAHRKARDKSLEALQFPHVAFRKGQRVLAEAVYQAAATDRHLLIEAPTGIGKTVGTLFPLLKALPRQGLDKIIFLCAKTPGRRLAMDAVVDLGCESVRTLELVAREKSCEHPDKACHGESCPLAQGFYDRLPQARIAAAGVAMLTQARLREIALAHNVCPYYLSQEMVRWSDLVVGDYNYYLDLSAMLYTLTLSNQWQVALLVDEAHNVVDRARAMYSAELHQTRLRAIKKDAPQPVKPSLDKVNREWNALNRALPEDSRDHYVQAALPDKLLYALQSFTSTATDYFAENPAVTENGLMQFYFDALHFMRVAELFSDQTFIFDISIQSGRAPRKSSQLNLRNLIPAALLAHRFAAARTATLFSATLRPAAFYRDVLGLPAATAYKEVESPFAPDQLEVNVINSISTRYRDRQASVIPIATLISEQYEKLPGNYLAFFSSYQYLEQVLEAVRCMSPTLPVWAQARNMDEPARADFLQRFQHAGQGVGFAVLGGAFAEGVDLPGDRLIGAFIATLGLPQTNDINEHLKRHLNNMFGDGYNYTYLYPGLRKVVQAAGRVIRTEQDKGVVYLIDDRFNTPAVRALLPQWWNI